MTDDSTHELITRAHRLWKEAGPLASSAKFAASIMLTKPIQLLIMADIGKVGRKGSMLTRCTRMIPVETANDSSLRELVEDLYRLVKNAVVEADSIGVKF